MSYQDTAKQNNPSNTSTLNLTTVLGFSVLALAVGWIIFAPVALISKIIEIACLLTAAKFVMWRTKHSQQTELVSTRSRQTYLINFERSESLDERQQILDEMASLELLKNAEMSGIDLAYMNLAKANLSGADLSLSKQQTTNMREANLTGTSLRLASMNYSNLQEANLAKANLSGATLNSSDLSSSNLQGANLSAASLIDCDLCAADLSGANLRHANLQHANLSLANLENADLSFAVMPDGSTWTSDTNMRAFTHPEYQVNLAQMLFAKTRTGEWLSVKGDDNEY